MTWQMETQKFGVDSDILDNALRKALGDVFGGISTYGNHMLIVLFSYEPTPYEVATAQAIVDAHIPEG